MYVMGKAATLNGRVGDVMLSGNVYDEHSRNTFLFDNASAARTSSRHLRYGSVFDNQAALTVRSAFLQNRNYMNAFYRDGYTVLEMEAGPFLASVYELVNPTHVRSNEIVHLSGRAVRRRAPSLRVGHAVLAPPVAPLEEPQLLRRRQHVRVRDRDRAAHLRARDRARHPLIEKVAVRATLST